MIRNQMVVDGRELNCPKVCHFYWLNGRMSEKQSLTRRQEHFHSFQWLCECEWSQQACLSKQAKLSQSWLCSSVQTDVQDNVCVGSPTPLPREKELWPQSYQIVSKDYMERNLPFSRQCHLGLKSGIRNWFNLVLSLVECKCPLQWQMNLQNISERLASPSSFQPFEFLIHRKICIRHAIQHCRYSLSLQHMTLGTAH